MNEEIRSLHAENMTKSKNRGECASRTLEKAIGKAAWRYAKARLEDPKNRRGFDRVINDVTEELIELAGPGTHEAHSYVRELLWGSGAYSARPRYRGRPNGLPRRKRAA